MSKATVLRETLIFRPDDLTERPFIIIRFVPLCKCGHQASPLHPCPYNEDVNDDPTPICTCCDHCAALCADEI